MRFLEDLGDLQLTFQQCFSMTFSLTNANMVLCTVRVKLSESDPEPMQKLDEGEHIIKRVVEVKELYNVLLGSFYPGECAAADADPFRFSSDEQTTTRRGSRSTLDLPIGRWDTTWRPGSTRSKKQSLNVIEHTHSRDDCLNWEVIVLEYGQINLYFGLFGARPAFHQAQVRRGLEAFSTCQLWSKDMV